MKRMVLFLTVILAFGVGSLVAVNIPAGNTITETFAIGTTATATLPTDWKVDSSTSVRTVGSYTAAGTATTQVGGNTMSTSAASGIYNYGAGVASSATDRAVGYLSGGSTNKNGNIYVKLVNSGSTSINDFTISYDVEKYRNGLNAAGFSIQMYYSTDGTSWTNAGSNFLTSFAADADNAGYASAPATTVAVSLKTLSQSLAASGTLYLAWNYSVTTGTTITNAQGLGIDNVVITANGSAPTPTIIVTGSFSNFTTTVGTASASQNVAVSGTNLSGNVNVAAVTGYEFSTNNAAPWTSTLSAAAPYTCYARLTGASVGSFPGTVAFTSSGATEVDKSVNGTVNPLTPVINVTGTFSAFSTTTGTPSASQSVAVFGSNLTANIGVSAVAGYEYSTTNAAPWTSTLSLATNFNGSVYVRLTGTTLGSYPGTISFTSTGATQVDLTLSGSVTAPPPVITVTGTFSTFSTSSGTPSASQYVAVVGSNLTADISVSAVAGYEYSTTNAAPWTSTLSLDQAFNGNVYVRLTGLIGGLNSGTISFSSTGATQVDKTLSGTVTVIPIPVVMSSQPLMSYTESFTDVATWTNNFASGNGAAPFGSVAINATGTIPDGVRITTSTATFSSSSTGGVQKGTGNIVLLSTGSTDNSSSAAIDFYMDFSGVNAGTLSFDWACVFNSTGNRCGSMRVYSSTDGISFTELTSAQVLNVVNNVASGASITSVALPSSFNGSSTARLRFYYYNGTGGTTGSRPKISIDNLTVTAVASTIPITISSNILGAKIYRNSIETAFTTPHIFDETPADVITYGVQTISTQVTPATQTITISTPQTVTFTYTNPANTTGGGAGSGADVVTNGGSINITTSGVTVTGTSGAAGLLVVTKVTPASKGTYHGYLHVSEVYQVWASDAAMLNGGSLSFAYTPTTPNYVAVHWGGDNNGYYPVDHPETAGIPTPGYAFNGATSQYGYNLGTAPFTSASYIGGVLTLGPIPAYTAKGPGTFEIILNTGDYDLPVELSSFTAVSSTSQLLVTLQWTTESETNNLGFNILRSDDFNIAHAINLNGNIITGTNTSTAHTYNYQDETVEAPHSYYYWLENVDFTGYSRFNGPVIVNVLEQGDPDTPPVIPGAVTKLNGAYPNPFNPQTIISYDLKSDSDVLIQVFNINGQLIRTLVNRHQLANHYTVAWLGNDEQDQPVGSGIYLYRMVAGKYSSTQKVVLMK